MATLNSNIDACREFFLAEKDFGRIETHLLRFLSSPGPILVFDDIKTAPFFTNYIFLTASILSYHQRYNSKANFKVCFVETHEEQALIFSVANAEFVICFTTELLASVRSHASLAAIFAPVVESLDLPRPAHMLPDFDLSAGPLGTRAWDVLMRNDLSSVHSAPFFASAYSMLLNHEVSHALNGHLGFLAIAETIVDHLSDELRSDIRMTLEYDADCGGMKDAYNVLHGNHFRKVSELDLEKPDSFYLCLAMGAVCAFIV